MATVTGLDIGTTSAKAAVFDAGGRMRDRAERPYDGDVVAGALEALEAVPRADVVALSGAMHSLIGLDERDRPVTELLTWDDDRATAQAERLPAALHARTGTPRHPVSPLAKLVWMREHGVSAHRWVGVKELVVHRLTGEWVTDHSTASGTGLMDLRTLDWDPEALALAGVRSEQLPRLAPATERLGDLVVGAGDGPCANLGLGAVEPGVAACSIGTSGALRVVVGEPVSDPRLFCYALTPGRWVVGGATSNGGNVLAWLSDLLRAEVEDLLADLPADSAGLVFRPHLWPERAPDWDARREGAVEGLSHRHTRGHLVRAALEGVCHQLRLVLDALRDAGHAVDEIRATGGFARSEPWKQILADELEMPVGFTDTREGSAFGGALLGFRALGEVPAPVRVVEVVEPSGG